MGKVGIHSGNVKLESLSILDPAGAFSDATDTGGAVSLDKDDISGYLTIDVNGTTKYIFLFDSIPSAV